MANTKGSAENPLNVEDMPEPHAYIQIDSDDEVTELSVYAVPAASRARHKSKWNGTNSILGSGSFSQQKSDSAEIYPRHTSSTQPDLRKVLLTLSDDDEPEVVRRRASRRTGTDNLSSGAKAATSSTGGKHPAVSRAQLPERTKTSEPSTRSIPLSRATLPSALEGCTVPQASSITTSATIGKEKTPPVASLSVKSAAQGTTQSGGVNAAYDRFVHDTPQDGRPQERQEISTPYARSSTNIQARDGTSIQGINDTRVDVSVQKVPYSQIGGRADPECEQTTSGRVKMNATSTSARVTTINETGEVTRLPGSIQSSGKLGGSHALKVLQKPRAVKSAASPPRRKHSNRPNLDSARNYAHSPSPVQVSSRSSCGVTPSDECKVDKEPSEKSGSNLDHQSADLRSFGVANRLPSNALLRDRNSVLAGVEAINMGAQLSASPAAPSPVLSSHEIPNTVHGTASMEPPRTQSTLLRSALLEKENREKVSQAKLPSELIITTDDQVASSDIEACAAIDIEAARRGIEVALKRHLNDKYEDHAYLVKNAMWRQRTCHEREIRAQGSDKRTQKIPQLPDKFVQSASPFANMSTIQSPFERSGSKESLKDVTQEIFTKATSKDTMIKSSWSVRTTKYKPEVLRLPSFKEYVSLTTNILADNESKLLTIPWLDDDDEEAQNVLVKKLPLIYEIKHDINALLDLRNEQCRFYTRIVDIFLADMGLTWDTIIYWLLSPDSRLERINKTLDRHKDFDHILSDRSLYAEEVFRRAGENRAVLFERSSGHWKELLQQLQEPSAVQLRVAALASAALFANCNFSPWYLARQSKTMQAYVQRKTKAAQTVPNFFFRGAICRVCHEHNCMFHGQIREEPESGAGSDSEEQSTEEDSDDNESSKGSRTIDSSLEDDTLVDENSLVPAHVDEDDTDVEKIVNYRLPVNPDVSVNETWPDCVVAKRAIPPPGAFKPKWWELNTSTATWEKRKPFIPCNHIGSCAEARCRCFREGVTCEKTCRCPLTCNRRFPGCKCASVLGKRACSTAAGCICVRFKRECDADLCGTCGATELLDPVNRYNEDLLQERCTNVGIQRGVPKKTLLGQSEVHGFGLYAGQDIRKDDIIGEYTGEILSVEESGRRIIIYEYEKNMYLFKLNKTQEVDATHMGNKLRFINNANKNRSNCYPKNLFCNTVFRIALYATTDIKAGTELFFHYNYPEELTKNFKQPKGKVVAVKEIVRQPSKAKLKRASSTPSSAGAYIDRPRPRNHEALAIARAAKAAKRAAMLAEKGLQTPGTGVKQARKSTSTGPNGYQKLKNSNSRGRTERVRDLEIPEAPNASASAVEADHNANTRAPTLVVQDTDEEDDDSVPDSRQEGTNTHGIPSFHTGEDGVELANGNDINTYASLELCNRPRIGKPAPVVVVKKVKKKMGGVRPGAGRKRKRPLVLNSDEE